MSTKPLAITIAATLLQVADVAPGEPVDCAACHTPQATELSRSSHANLRCQECHAGPDSYDLSESNTLPYRGVNNAPQNRKAFDHGPSFLGKPARSTIPNLCGDCHADVARMNLYGMRTDQLSSYWVSGHGRVLRERGDDRVAVCIDCHGSHAVLPAGDAASRTNPMNIPDTCGVCHADEKLMVDANLPFDIVDEYRDSVHGTLLLGQGDFGSPSCATCHGSHGAAPPGFASVGSVCGQCHQHASGNFATSIHAGQDEFNGCIQCHGGGPNAHGHGIERITKPTGVLIQRYAHLLAAHPMPTPQRIADALRPDPSQMMHSVLESCTDCHEELDEDDSLPKMFELLDKIADAEQHYVETAAHLDRLARGVSLVENQRFKFEEATTHLIGLAPLQHTLNNELVAAKVAELNKVCDEVQTDLSGLEADLRNRRAALVPIWLFAVGFSIALYAKYKRLKEQYVKPLDDGEAR